VAAIAIAGYIAFGGGKDEKKGKKNTAQNDSKKDAADPLPAPEEVEDPDPLTPEFNFLDPKLSSEERKTKMGEWV